jgi:ATP-binding cassette subfamily B protein
LGRSQGKIIQLIMGMTDVRQNNCEQTLLQSWAGNAAETAVSRPRFFCRHAKAADRLFLLQENTEYPDTYLSACAVLSGDITIGMMLAIQFIIGQ